MAGSASVPPEGCLETSCFDGRGEDLCLVVSGWYLEDIERYES